MPNEDTDLSPVESPSDQSPDEVRDSLGIDVTEGPGESFEISTSTDRDAISDLQRRGEEDAGPSDDEILAEEGFDRDAEQWLSENSDALAGKLVEPKTADDVRANARLVRETRARLEAEERADRLEEAQTLAEIQSQVEDLLESGEADEEDVANAIREQHPEALIPFLQSWAEYDSEAAEAYYLDAVAEEGAARIARDRRVREQVERDREAEIALAFDAAMEKHKLSERGQELVKQIVQFSPGALTSISSPAEAAERADELVRGALEVQRASEEQEIRKGIAAEHNRTEMSLGWGVAEEIPEFDLENRIRSANVFPKTKPKTVGEMKREMLESESGGVEDFAAKYNPKPVAPNSSRNDRLRKIMAGR